MPKTSRCFDRGCARQRGQASVEAAFLIPTLLLIVALLAQPVCVLYTQTAMQGAAAEGARALATAYGRGANSDAVRAFILRRLGSVPDLALFHVGGDAGWEIELEGGAQERVARVSIAGHLELLPLAGGVAHAFGLSSGRDLVVRVSVEEAVRPDWLEGGYDDWVSVWDS